MNRLYAALLVYTFALRLFELRLSRAHETQLRALDFERRDTALSYYCMFFVHAAWLCGLIAEPLLMARPVDELLIAVSLAIFLSAQLLRLWTISSLGIFWNVHIMTPVKGSSVPSNWPVTSGPYQFIRHPNYIVVMLEFASLPLIGGAFITAAVGCLLNLAVLANRISAEDRSLETLKAYREKFGADSLAEKLA